MQVMGGNVMEQYHTYCYMIKRVIMQYLVFYLNTHFNAVTICVNSNFAEGTTYI